MTAKTKNEKTVNDHFFSKLKQIFTSKAKDKVLKIDELGDRFAISVGDIRVAAVLKKTRSKQLTMHLSKFKAEASTIMLGDIKRNLVSYGKAGVFAIVEESRLDEAVEVFDTHLADLRRVAEIRKSGF